ncbi:tRNA (uridine(34)/cytosine(34)/5-carboxymethylaminomethyluridine(34)-2'-O)-methyltransferase TrmL [Paramaledivibacter caminithermalis]|jgi:tRNA (cytidine/uridine-2'-O-)-methyltransferase|uniref:Putative tRNA (cytidine(34)-2'-O)-methyltransferase n=1 Tax=Paramaledivibacter caminithermalis (strain DSM 15212 / CIP 107654 / DViRD3) TaxID=1121301 RepID=A0A1M6MKN5_PARC5|nr:tRNA (uridine(34)/cytosine(34)/5-carboxymethylaminomethyluridine(34)-2'-O)-methyltransferase TrmL [Paramaledivibacter caminithermalis]SHJ83843.1 tRNA (cytidine/uridine-2'-O-)-methyltransferase [Paramaledivibacter caminithermalis DSM 15212]
MAINIVLYQPEIPQNTGNIARTCAITGSRLHLIKPLGFSIDNKYLKRAGLDYWHLLDINIYENAQEFFSKYSDGDFYISTTKASENYTDVKYKDECFIIFGKETAGLPNEIHERFKNKRIKIPMINDAKARSLNLSNSVAIVVYEALRQLDFQNMK